MEIVTTLSGRLLELFDAASVVSEGNTRDDEGGPLYYGSTTILFSRCAAGGIVPDSSDPDLAFALQHDPHARLQIVRIAHREAWARAGSTIGPLHADVHVDITARGVMVSIDVVAKVRRGRASGALF